jgi:hypothetical protein
MTLDDEGRSTAEREVVRFIPVPTSVSEQAQRSSAWTCSVAVLDDSSQGTSSDGGP